jgi:hypothetical protein
MRRLAIVCHRYGLAVWVAACASHPEHVSTSPGPIWFEPTAGCATRGANLFAPVRATDAITPALAQQRPDAARAYAARRLPGGYAGGPVYFSPPMHAILWLRDTTAKDSVLRALPSLPGLAWTKDTGGTTVEVRQAEYDAAMAYDWLNYLMSRGLFRHGVSSVGMGPEGRIAIGAVAPSDLPQIVALLEAEHVPCRLVTLQVTGPVHVL